MLCLTPFQKDVDEGSRYTEDMKGPRRAPCRNGQRLLGFPFPVLFCLFPLLDF
mgnify:CR=1 FL=1